VKHAPGPGLSILLQLQAMRRDPLGFMQRAREQYGDVVRLGVGRTAAYLIGRHELADHVLVDHHENYDRETRSARAVRFVTGDSILTTSGDPWKRRRRILQPPFQSGAVRDIAPLVVRRATTMLDRWNAGDVIDAGEAMTHLTFAIAGEAFFGADVEPFADEIEALAPVILEEAFRRSTDIIPTHVFRRTAARRFDRATRRLVEIVDDVVSHGGRRSLIASLLATEDDGQPRLTPVEVRNETLALLLAGHETTSNALTWCIDLLTRNPAVLTSLVCEVRSVLNGRSPGVGDLDALPLVHAAVQESIRLYPSVWIVERRAIEDDSIGGYDIPAGAMVYVSPYLLHRDPRFWADPERFDPTRFVDAPKQRRPSYIPFGAGPHHCIGAHFAMVEARLVLAALLQRFDLVSAGEKQTEADAWITLRPRTPVRVRVHPAGH
jgi:cytochrome P450